MTSFTLTDAKFKRNFPNQQELHQSQGKIERDTSSYKEKVASIIDREKAQYISSGNSGDMEFLDDTMYAFETYVDVIQDNEGKIIVYIQPNESISIRDGHFIIGSDRYDQDEYKHTRMKKIVAVRREDISTEKPKEVYYKFYIGGSKKYIPVSKVLKEYTQSAELGEISLMELTYIPDYKVSIDLIRGKLGKKIPGGDWSSNLARLYVEACDFLEKRAPILAKRQEFFDLRKKSFSTEQDVLDFLNIPLNLKNRREGIVACTLAKFVYLLIKLEESEIFQYIKYLHQDDDHMRTLIRSMFSQNGKYLLDEEQGITKDQRGVFVFQLIPQENSSQRKKVTFRIKSIESIMHKCLSDPLYLDIEKIPDLIGVSRYFGDSNDSILQAIEDDDTITFLGDGFIEEKGLLTKVIEGNENDIGNYKVGAAVREFGKNKKGKKISGSQSYIDAKQKGYVSVLHDGEEISLGCEIKYLSGEQTNEQNEKGTSWHVFYDYFFKHFKGEKNRNPFLTARNVSDLLVGFYPYLKQEAQKYSKDTTSYLRDELYTELAESTYTTRIDNEQDFYEVKIIPLLLQYLVKRFKLKRYSLGNEIVLVSEENLSQLSHGLRGWKKS